MRFVLVKTAKGKCPPCSPKAKKKILIKHHEKDLREAVEEKDQNYAKKTVKDIEEISAGKHAAEKAAILMPGLAKARKGAILGQVAKSPDAFRGGVGTIRRAQGLKIEGASHPIGSAASERNWNAATHLENAENRLNRVQRVQAFRPKHAEQLADELDMVEGCDPQFLNEAPLPRFAFAPLPPLSSKLAYDRDGLRVRISDDIVESMMKIAAKPPIGLKPGEIEVLERTIRYDPARAAAMQAARETAERAQAPISFGEAVSRGGRNLWNNAKKVMMGEGGAGKAQAALVGGIVLGAGLGIQQLYKRRQRQQQYAGVLAAVMDDPHFKNVEQKEDKVPEAYSFLRRYAPTLALDPVIARSFVRQAVESDVSWMNQTVAQGLAEAETKHRDASRPSKDLRDLITNPFVSPFTGGKGSDKDK